MNLGFFIMPTVRPDYRTSPLIDKAHGVLYDAFVSEPIVTELVGDRISHGPVPKRGEAWLSASRVSNGSEFPQMRYDRLGQAIGDAVQHFMKHLDQVSHNAFFPVYSSHCRKAEAW